MPDDGWPGHHAALRPAGPPDASPLSPLGVSAAMVAPTKRRNDPRGWRGCRSGNPSRLSAAARLANDRAPVFSPPGCFSGDHARIPGRSGHGPPCRRRVGRAPLPGAAPSRNGPGTRSRRAARPPRRRVKMAWTMAVALTVVRAGRCFRRSSASPLAPRRAQGPLRTQFLKHDPPTAAALRRWPTFRTRGWGPIWPPLPAGMGRRTDAVPPPTARHPPTRV